MKEAFSFTSYITHESPVCRVCAFNQIVMRIRSGGLFEMISPLWQLYELIMDLHLWQTDIVIDEVVCHFQH